LKKKHTSERTFITSYLSTFFRVYYTSKTYDTHSTCSYDYNCHMASEISESFVDDHPKADASDERIFSLDSIMQSIIDVMMIGQWTKSISYEQYYDQCTPVVCTYFKEERRTSLFAFAKLVGLLRDLTLLPSFTIPYVIRFIREIADKQWI
jgi:hypothetical protein